nr:MAG TPA: hypothetical protein [Caudoviricetes sp.]
MVGLYDYDNATEEECLDDLQEIIEYFINGYDLGSLDTLEKKGQRIKYIAERLKELGGGENV